MGVRKVITILPTWFVVIPSSHLGNLLLGLLSKGKENSETIIIKRVNWNTGSKANVTLYLEQFANFMGHFFLLLIKNNWVSYLLPLAVPFNFSIQ